MTGEKISHDGGELVVTVPLLAKLDAMSAAQAAGFAAIGEKLNGKADKTDVARLERRLDDHATRLSQIESTNHDEVLLEGEDRIAREERLTRREKILGGVGIVFLGCTTVLSPLIAVWATKH